MDSFFIKYKKYFIAVILIFIAVVCYYIWQNNKTMNFAECVSQKAVFYGASWCPNCMIQKGLFGDAAAAKLTYVECSTDEKQPQLQTCTDLKISKYPTWIFSDGTRLEGVQFLKTLSEKTGCAI